VSSENPKSKSYASREQPAGTLIAKWPYKELEEICK